MKKLFAISDFGSSEDPKKFKNLAEMGKLPMKPNFIVFASKEIATGNYVSRWFQVVE